MLKMPKTCAFIAQYPSVEKALETLKCLSFVVVDEEGLFLPSSVFALVFDISTGAAVFIGGSLSTEQADEAFRLFRELG